MSFDASRYFKSVSLRLDADHPERFTHFYPTSKSASVIRAIVHGEPDRASIAVASYGSGKSLTAGTAALVIDNDPKLRKQLRDVAQRIARVDGQLGDFAKQRTQTKLRGLPVLLEGHQGNLPEALLEQAKRRVRYLREPQGSAIGAIAVLEKIAEQARKQKIDRIAIVWDEFGQHLEMLVVTGRADSLLTVQQLAEWADRQKKPSATLTLLLHQNLAQYAGSLSQIARAGWRKIEGRFGLLRYVEDSDEIYELIATVVASLRPKGRLPAERLFREEAKQALASGLFTSYTRHKDLPQVLSNAYPLLPATLHALPKLASRLAQNERTIFSFLREADLRDRVSLQDLYLYFSAAMQADSGIGGSHRRWLETESARSKVYEPIEKEILAAAALLGLGTSGERTRISKHSLVFAATGAGGHDPKSVTEAIKSLIGRKLLLYRKNNDDISVWHGTDVDVRTRLQAMRDNLEGQLDITGFLNREQPAQHWRPVAHNFENLIRRYYEGRYVLAGELGKLGQDHPALVLNPDEDGAIIYCLAENRKEIEECTAVAMQSGDRHGTRVVFAIPAAPIAVSDLALEITALRSLQEDAELLGADPFVLPELQHMVDAAQENMTLVLQRLVRPDGSNTWIAAGKQLKSRSDYELQRQLSRFADERYTRTPLFNNELIVRRKVSRPLVNARKKLILGILERSGTEHLGFDPAATTPDVTLYRTVLRNTGLYRKQGKTWRWANPSKENPGLAAVWQKLKEFFTTPGEGKSFKELLDMLASPPYGTRSGLMPILLAAGMKAFGRAIAIRQEGSYLPDILASQIEEICAAPAEYAVDVFECSAAYEKNFTGLIEVFSRDEPDEGDLVRQLYDTIVSWKSRLPKAALTTRKVSSPAQALQRALRGDLDPVKLAEKFLSHATSSDKPDIRGIKDLSRLVHEIEGIVDGYTTNATDAIHEHLAISSEAPGDMLQRAQEWAVCFTDSTDLRYGHEANAILLRALEAASGKYTKASFARALSAILLGKNFEQWDDASARLFVDRLRDVISSIEHAALTSPKPPLSLMPLLTGRIKHMTEVLSRLSDAAGTENRPAAGQKPRGHQQKKGLKTV